MSNVEKLHFKITLAGTYWKKAPKYSIIIDNDVVVSQEVTTPSGESFDVEFDRDINEGPFVLKIRLENKTDADVLKDNYDDPNNFTIIGDMLLNIKHVEIDEIDLSNLIYAKSVFNPDSPSRPVLDNCVDLGWNGTWVLESHSPFYLWLLENI